MTQDTPELTRTAVPQDRTHVEVEVEKGPRPGEDRLDMLERVLRDAGILSSILVALLFLAPVARAQVLDDVQAARPAAIPLAVSVEIHRRLFPVILRLETPCPGERDCRLIWTAQRCVGGTCATYRITQVFSNPYRAFFTPKAAGRYLVSVKMETCEPSADMGNLPDVCAVWVQRGETGVNFRF